MNSRNHSLLLFGHAGLLASIAIVVGISGSARSATLVTSCWIGAFCSVGGAILGLARYRCRGWVILALTTFCILFLAETITGWMDAVPGLVSPVAASLALAASYGLLAYVAHTPGAFALTPGEVGSPTASRPNREEDLAKMGRPAHAHHGP